MHSNVASDATQDKIGRFLILKEIGNIRDAKRLPLFETHFFSPLPLPPVCSSATIHKGVKKFFFLRSL